jgi:CRISPR-associated protein Csm3
MQLLNIVTIQGTITLKSGLHIGAGDVEMRIGGTDNPVVKHPISQEPYIPGSSIKGKVRSLLELKSGLVVKTNGNPLNARLLRDLKGGQHKECETILKLFGTSGADGEAGAELGPSRASFADCPLTEGWRQKARASRFSLTEVKSENSINRIKGTAENPRFTERVPADTEFAFSVSLRILAPGEEEVLLDALLEGLRLLELDALGGSGSRGYGKVKFRFDDADIQSRFVSVAPFSTGGKP